MKERFRASAVGILAVVLLVTGHCLAQTQMWMCHTGDTGEVVPPARLPVPLRLTGIGTVHFPISANGEAQVWFDQGMNLFEDFWDYEAARAFQQSIRSDPNCAMCYWGLYQAEGLRQTDRQQYALEALNKAAELSKHATSREKLYIRAAQAHEQKSAKTDSKGNSKEIETFRTLVKKNPKDTNARIFLAEALEDGFDKQGEPKPGQKEAQNLLQGVMREEPNNSAANHLFIHAVEAGAHPEQALASADILASLAPTSGHMVHMPGHIYYRTGQYARAQNAFDASTQADESYLRQQHVAVDDDWNYVHNLMYSVANLLEEGHFKDAERISSKLLQARGNRADTLYPWSPRDSIARLNPELPIALRGADWARVTKLVDAANLPSSMPHLELLAGDLAEFALGLQAVEAHQPDTAERHSVLLDASLWRLSQEIQDEKGKVEKGKTKANGAVDHKTSTDPLAQPLLSALTIMSLELRGTIVATQGRASEAEKLFSSAQEREADLGYHEPPWYVRPASESEGAALMTAGKWAEAEAAYRRELLQRPQSGFSLYGIALAEEKSGDSNGAAAAYRQFLTAWKTADPDLPQLEHAQQWLMQHDGEPAPGQAASVSVR
jgi:tetratricopeptide (TPR) repeat protein